MHIMQWDFTTWNKPETSKGFSLLLRLFPYFATTFNPATPNVKTIVIITGNNTLMRIYPGTPIVACPKEKSL